MAKVAPQGWEGMKWGQAETRTGSRAQIGAGGQSDGWPAPRYFRGPAPLVHRPTSPLWDTHREEFELPPPGLGKQSGLLHGADLVSRTGQRAYGGEVVGVAMFGAYGEEQDERAGFRLRPGPALNGCINASLRLPLTTRPHFPPLIPHPAHLPHLWSPSSQLGNRQTRSPFMPNEKRRAERPIDLDGSRRFAPSNRRPSMQSDPTRDTPQPHPQPHEVDGMLASWI